MTKSLTQQVGEAITKLYDVPVTYEYPGWLAIPESAINDETDGSDNVWAVGPDMIDGKHVWTGNLMSADGSEANVNEMAFIVYPQSTDPTEIASAVYTHGIGDLYVGGGCADPQCPRLTSPAATIFRPSYFSIDGLYDHVPGWTNDQHWNGWECPAFERTAVDQLMAAPVPEEGFILRFDAERDAVIATAASLEYPDDEDIAEGHDIRCADGQTRHVYSVGAWAWIWSEDETA